MPTLAPWPNRTVLSLLLFALLAPASQAGGLKGLLRGLGKLVGTAVKLASGGRRAQVGSSFHPSSLGPVAPVGDWQEAMGRSMVHVYVQGGVHRLLLRTPQGLLRVPVPARSTRRGSRLSLALLPGEYCWVGYEHEEVFSHSLGDGKKSRSFRTLCLWREEQAFSLPFSVLRGRAVYGGTLEVEVLAARGGGPSGQARNLARLMPPGYSSARAGLFGDPSLFRREAAEWIPDLSEVEDSPLAREHWVDRDLETRSFPSFLELERYLRWLERLQRQPHPANWPLDPTRPEGASFRKSLHRSWKAWVERHPPRRRRRLSMTRWIREAGAEDAAASLRSVERLARIRETFERRRQALEQARVEAEAVAAAAATAHGERQGMAADPRGPGPGPAWGRRMP